MVVLVGETLLDSTVTLEAREIVLQPPPIITETNLDVDGVADLECGKVGRERDGSVLAELAREHVAGSAAVSLGVAHPAVEKEEQVSDFDDKLPYTARPPYHKANTSASEYTRPITYGDTRTRLAMRDFINTCATRFGDF